MKILLVEDNLLNQKVVMFNLKKFNFDITAVSNGVDAINAARNEHYDLILMDLMLPEKSGIEVTIEIRKIEEQNGAAKPVPIIALTANTLDNDRDKCLEVGMNEYLSKPFTSDQLIEKINKFIQPGE